MTEIRKVKMRVGALVHRLQINKAIKFQTRIQWKRRTTFSIKMRKRLKPNWSITNTDTLSSKNPSISILILNTTKARASTIIKM